MLPVLRPQNKKVGEIEEHNAVGRFEEVVGLVAKILLKLILYGTKVIGNSIYPPWSYFGHRKVKEFAIIAEFSFIMDIDFNSDGSIGRPRNKMGQRPSPCPQTIPKNGECIQTKFMNRLQA